MTNRQKYVGFDGKYQQERGIKKIVEFGRLSIINIEVWLLSILARYCRNQRTVRS